MYRLCVKRWVVSSVVLIGSAISTGTVCGADTDSTIPDGRFPLEVMERLSPRAVTQEASGWSIEARAEAPVITYAGSTLWNTMVDVEVQGHFAFCAMGEGLAILDISDPVGPVWVSQVHLPGFGGYHLKVYEQRAYLADGYSGFSIVDVSDPLMPVWLGSHDTPEYARSVEVSGGTAYVSDFSYLNIFDVADPYHPVQIALDGPRIGRAYSSVVSGDYLYVAGGPSGIHVVNIAHPEAPFLVTTMQNVAHPAALAVEGDYLYSAPENISYLYKFDIINPATPQLSSTRSVGVIAWDMKVEQGVFYGSGDDYLVIADIDHPLPYPERDAYWDSLDNAVGLALVDTLLYVCDAQASLKILKHHGAGEKPVLVGEFDLPGYLDRVSMVGDLALVRDNKWPTGSKYGLHLVDVSDPRQPRVRGTVPSGGVISDAEGEGDFIYVADNLAGFEVVDIRDPDLPKVVTALQGLLARDVALAGGFAYLATADGLQILDLSTPSSPVSMGSVGGFGAASVVAVDGHHAYLGTTIGEFAVVDVSRPEAPETKGSIALPRIFDIAVLGSWAYVVNGAALLAIDVSDPEHPRQAGVFAMNSDPFGVAAQGEFVYVAARSLAYLAESGVLVFDVSNPAQPAPVARYASAGQPWDLALNGAQIIVADYDGVLSLARQLGYGDVNADGQISIADAVYLANYLFGGGPSPEPTPFEGDTDCNGDVDILDVVFLINHVFRGGPAPC